MASSDNAARFRHAPLATQQRRLRHLRSVAVRNIADKKQNHGSDLASVERYFTLHTQQDGDAVYTSEKIKGTLNPSWRSFNLDHIANCSDADSLNTATTFVIVRVWWSYEDVTEVSIECCVHLNGLVCLGEKLSKEGLMYPPNTVLFGLKEAVYGVPSLRTGCEPGYQSFQVDQSLVRESYNSQTLLRIKTIMRAIKQTQCSVHKVKKSIEDNLRHSRTLGDKRSERERQLLKNTLMAGDLAWRRQALHHEKELLESAHADNQNKEKELVSKFAILKQAREDIHLKKQGYFDTREDLIKTGAQLVMRRKQLISELAFIYPIAEVPNGDYTICGVKLPNSEDFAGQDETMIAVALGYTSHLVQMISSFLDVPLRYPMEHLGSRSYTRDHIIDKLKDRDREFPLFSKGKEKFQFNYAVYLLNKNVAQLRFYCALGTTDLRLTLPNLKSLLEFRLGVKFESTNAPVLAGQHQAIPPNLGGPQTSTSPFFGLTPRNEINSVHTSPDSPSQASSPMKSTSLAEISGSSSVDSSLSSKSSSLKEQDSVSSTSPSHNSQQFPQKNYSKASTASSLESRTSDVTDAHDGSRTSDVTDAHDGAIPKSKRHLCTHSSGFTQNLKNGSLEENSRCLQHQMSPKSSHSGTFHNKLTQDRLLGSAANFDEVDTSSNEESASNVYISRFKMWPRDLPEIQPQDPQWSSVQDTPEKTTDSSATTETSQDINIETPTFKTKAMESPTEPSSDQTPCNDLLNTAPPEKWLTPKPVNAQVAGAAGTFRRKRTDSDADSDESATFVIPQNSRKQKEDL